MKTNRMLIAITALGKLFSRMNVDEITAIQFEDGSGKKFNYQVNGGKWKFIDMTGFPEYFE